MCKSFKKFKFVAILKDDKFLELAVNGKAKYIITGDQDLLVLNPFQDIAIISVSDYLSLS